MGKYYDESPLSFNESKPKPQKNETYGASWSIRTENKKFYFSYISGELMGKLKEIEITEDDYNQIKQNKTSSDQICRKYGVS